MKHTTEPWEVHPDAAGIIVAKASPHESLLGLDIDEYASFMNEEDANRVVLCVNACAGMSEPEAEIAALRKDSDYLNAMASLLADARKQRDELLGFAEWVLSLKTGGKIEGQARAVIAMAKGGAA